MITVVAPEKKLSNYSVEVPPSKYIANRLLIIAAAAKGESTLLGIPKNADMEAAIEGLRALSAEIVTESKTELLQDVRINGFAAKPSLKGERLYTGDNGTFTRLITPWALLNNGEVLIEGSKQMNARPMKPLLNALERLGGKFQFPNKEWHLPFACDGNLLGGKCELQGNESSQYFSSLLLAAPAFQNGIEVTAHGSMASKSYVDMTIALMRKHGVEVIEESENKKKTFVVKRNDALQGYKGFKTRVVADASSATYFLALGALGLGRMHLKNFHPDSYSGIQGEAQFARVLQRMGAEIELPVEGGVTMFSTRKLQGITLNMSDMPDAVPTLAVVAAAASGTTKIEGIAHLRFKESNRMEGLAGQLRKAGVQIEITEDAMEITGGNVQPATLNSLGDHRLAMAFSLLSLLCKNVCIEDEGSVAKTYPSYFSVLGELGFTCKKNDR